MSKKSRKRNKKILAALALAGGAAMLGRGTPAAANVDSGRGSGLRDTVDSAKNWISKKTDVVSDAVPGSSFKPRVYPGTMLNERGPIVTDVNHPIHDAVRIPPGGARRFNTFSKGGSVKRGVGIAKRGFGRALKGK